MSATSNQEFVQVESIENWNRPEDGQSSSQPFEVQIMDASATFPTSHHALSSQRSSGPRRAIRGRRRLLRSPASAPPHSARRATRRHYFDATEQFLNRDKHWRTLTTEFVTENLRLREVELQQQTQWQTLFAKLIDLVQILEDKINK